MGLLEEAVPIVLARSFRASTCGPQLPSGRSTLRKSLGDLHCGATAIISQEVPQSATASTPKEAQLPLGLKAQLSVPLS
jgi:hypothetical protein